MAIMAIDFLDIKKYIWSLTIHLINVKLSQKSCFLYLIYIVKNSPLDCLAMFGNIQSEISLRLV